MKKTTIFLLLMVLCEHSLVAQHQFKLPLNIDVCQFQDSEKQSYLEISYAIPAASVTHIRLNADMYKYKLLARLKIYQADSLWAAKIWKLEQTLTDTTALTSRAIIDVIRYPVQNSATYRMTLSVRDMNNPALLDSVSTSHTYQSPDQTTIGLSDLIMASSIKKAGEKTADELVKYSYEVIPNPARLFGDSSPQLYYYYEAYNLLNSIPGKRYKCLCRVAEYKGESIENLVPPFRTKIKKYERGVIFGKIDISTLHSGIYVLTYGICDSAENVLISKKKEFYIHNPALDAGIRADASAIAPLHKQYDFLDNMTEAEINEEFSKMTYLLDKDQKKLFTNLTDLTTKREFLYSSWNSYHSIENLSPGDFRKLYLERIATADTKYKSAFRAGWKTDQGRVFILYGPPSDIERHPSTTSSKPYQIWQYEHLEGGIYFVFIDRMGLNKYELVHSTLRGELQDWNWQRLISTTISAF